MADTTESTIRVERPPERGTSALLEYFWSGGCDFRLFHFVADTVMAGDYAAYVTKRVLDGEDPKHEGPKILAREEPGPRVTALRKFSQELLEMFLSRIVDNFQVYLTEIIRMVLLKRPEILSGRKQEISLGYILGFNSIESLTQEIIETRVNSLSYDGFGEIEAWCTRRGIPLVVPDGDRDKVVELIAIRNLIVHNRGVVDDRFLKAVPSSGFREGEKRKLDGYYFFASLDLLNRIVSVSDGAIGGKFDLPRVEVPKELKARAELRWPKTEDTSETVPASQSPFESREESKAN